MKSALSRCVAGAAVAATVSGALLALAPIAHAAGSPPYEPDPQKVGGITFYNAAGQVVTSGSVNDRPIAAYAVGDALPRAGDGKAVLIAAQPNANAQTADWNTDYLSGFTAFPASSGPASIAALDASRPVVTGAGTDLSLQGFINEFPNDAAHQSNASYQNLYQLRIKTANVSGNQSDTYDVADVLVDSAAGTWTEVYPVNAGDTTPPSVTSISTPGGLTAPALVTFSESVTGLSAGAVRLVVTGTTTSVAVAVSCLSNNMPVACGGTFNRVRLTPVAPLTPGQHFTISVGAAATHDLAGNPSTASSQAFRALTTLEESNGVVTQAWPLVHANPAYGHSFVREHLAGASASWTFTGTNVTWWTVTGPDQGKAKLFVDGVRKLTVSNYSAAQHFAVARTVRGLSARRHTVRVLVLGLKGSTKGKGTFVSIDAFSVGKTRTATPSLAMTWRSISSSHLFGGHAIVADLAGASVTLRFRGTGISIYTLRAVTQGKASVFIDGSKKLTINDAAATTKYRVRHSIGGLADKVHTLKIVVVGPKLITVDRFAVS